MWIPWLGRVSLGRRGGTGIPIRLRRTEDDWILELRPAPPTTLKNEDCKQHNRTIFMDSFSRVFIH